MRLMTVSQLLLSGYFEIEEYSIVPFRGASPLKIEQAKRFRQNLPFHSKIYW